MKNIGKYLALFLIILIGFLMPIVAELKPIEYNEQYVKKEIENTLEYRFGEKFIVDILTFNKDGILKEVTAKAYPLIDPSLVIDVTGQINEDYDDYLRVGTAYEVKSNFIEVFENKLHNEITKKYNFELRNKSYYETISDNIVEYIKKYDEFVLPYKDGSYFQTHYKDSYKSIEIPFTYKGSNIAERIYIDNKTNLVIIERDKNESLWQGELTILEYLYYITK